MAEVQLSAIRIGFPYTVQIDFPAGFLAVGESVRTKFRRFEGDTAFTPTPTRVGDSITWELDETQTALMEPGVYVAEAEVFETGAPANKGIPLTNNRYVAECDHSPAE